MADDLSARADGSMWATGMLAGGTAGNDAMTAEGSVPAEPLEGREDPEPLDVEPSRGSFRRTVHGERGGNADGSWTDAAGGTWGPVTA